MEAWAGWEAGRLGRLGEYQVAKAGWTAAELQRREDVKIPRTQRISARLGPWETRTASATGWTR